MWFCLNVRDNCDVFVFKAQMLAMDRYLDLGHSEGGMSSTNKYDLPPPPLSMFSEAFPVCFMVTVF